MTHYQDLFAIVSDPKDLNPKRIALKKGKALKGKKKQGLQIGVSKRNYGL